MMSLRARLAMSVYRGLGVGLYPALRLYLSLRAFVGKEDPKRRSERHGYASQPRPRGPLIWVHASSVGETNAVISLIKEIRNKQIQILLTTGTITSAQVATKRLGDTVIHQYVPIDIKPTIDRFLDYWQPDLALFVESEIWPLTADILAKRHIPQILVNARMSDRSYKRWKRFRSIAEHIMEKYALVIAQSETDGERFEDIGALPVLVSGNLKADADMPPSDQVSLSFYRSALEGRSVWAAISTFDGEERAAATVHLMLKSHMNLLTIIVPRHPERMEEIAKMLSEMGLNVAIRSRNEPILPDTDILLGDTIGEMALYLSLTEIAFVGRSLTAEGGQNPLEPALMGCAILSGGHVGNFRESYQLLARHGSARMVRDTEMLAKGVYYLFSNDEARQKMIEAGLETVHQMRGALPFTMRGLDPYINPLAMKARLSTRSEQNT